jgi:hypothetical protein
MFRYENFLVMGENDDIERMRPRQEEIRMQTGIMPTIITQQRYADMVYEQAHPRQEEMRRRFNGDVMARNVPMGRNAFTGTSSQTFSAMFSWTPSISLNQQAANHRQWRDAQDRAMRAANDFIMSPPPVLERNEQGKTYVVDVESSKKAALDLIHQIVSGIPKELESKAEMKELKRRVKLLEKQIKKETAIGQPMQSGTRSIDMEEDDE